MRCDVLCAKLSGSLLHANQDLAKHAPRVIQGLGNAKLIGSM